MGYESSTVLNIENDHPQTLLYGCPSGPPRVCRLGALLVYSVIRLLSTDKRRCYGGNVEFPMPLVAFFDYRIGPP